MKKTATLFLSVLLFCRMAGGQAFRISPQPFGRAHQKTNRNAKITRLWEQKALFNIIQGNGMPSHVGWNSGKLNRLTEWADSSEPNRPIICPYQPNGLWLWLKWRGTALKSTWPSVLAVVVAGLAFHYYVRYYFGLSPKKLAKWPWYEVPPSTEPLMIILSGLKKAWKYHLTICTFILTFFTSQAFAYWQKVYDKTRMIQGRINDFCYLLVTSAERAAANKAQTEGSKNDKESPVSDQKGAPRGYSERGRDLINTCTRLIRMSHIFFWAATPTASNGLSDSERFLEDTANFPLFMDSEHIGPLMLSPFGLKELVKSGQLTKQEAQDLNSTKLPPAQYAYILLVWVGQYTMAGLQQGILKGGTGLETNLLNQLTALRASMFDIDDFRAGRMSLAYVQMVQVLVDSLVALSPFAFYPELGILSVPLAGLMALFFRGLLVLSKSFLDPFGVEGYDEQNIRVDVLVSEINFGASQRWLQAGATLPGLPVLE